MATCKECGNEYKKTTSNLYCSSACKRTATFVKIKCKECNNLFETRKKHPNTYCSQKCSRKNKNYKLELEKRKRTTFDKYGVEHVLSHPDIINTRKLTNIKRYGVDNPAKLKSVRQKISSNRKEYDYNRLMSLYDGKLIPNFSLEDFTNGDRTTDYEFVCDECGHVFDSKIKDGIFPKCVKCYPKYISSYEIELVEFLTSTGVENIIQNTRSIIPSGELDIYLPDYNVAIEFNGIYWHSELAGKDKNYHLTKYVECQEQGIKLIHIFENEWVYKKEIVKSLLMYLLNKTTKSVFPRKCSIKTVSTEDARMFLEETHLQGYSPSSVNIGLYDDDDAVLVSLMTFSKSRFNKNVEWELVRFANKLNCKIPGAANKLYKYFVKTYNPISVISYCDKRYFNGGLYEQIGFTYDGDSPPNYFYFERGSIHLESRNKFQKHTLSKNLRSFSDGKTEWENMVDNGYNRIWDCGNKRFIWKNEIK